MAAVLNKRLHPGHHCAQFIFLVVTYVTYHKGRNFRFFTSLLSKVHRCDEEIIIIICVILVFKFECGHSIRSLLLDTSFQRLLQPSSNAQSHQRTNILVASDILKVALTQSLSRRTVDPISSEYSRSNDTAHITAYQSQNVE